MRQIKYVVASALLLAVSVSPVRPEPPSGLTAADRLADKLFPKWKLSSVPDPAQPTFLKKQAIVCKSVILEELLDNFLLKKGLFRTLPGHHYSSYAKNAVGDGRCAVADEELRVMVLYRCEAKRKRDCDELLRLQNDEGIVFITWDSGPAKAITEKSSLRN